MSPLCYLQQVGKKSELQMLSDISTKISLVVGKVCQLDSAIQTVQQNQTTHIGMTRKLSTVQHALMPVYSQAGSNSILPVQVTPEPVCKKLKRQVVLSSPSAATPLTPMHTAAAPAILTAQRTVLVLTEWTVSNLVYNWYAEKMYIEDSTLKGDDRTDMNRLAKLICYCKCFMPDNTVLTCRPAYTDVSATDTWATALRTLAVKVEERMLAHILEHKGGKITKAKLFASCKKLQALPKNLLPKSIVVDRAVMDAQASGIRCLNYTSVFDL